MAGRSQPVGITDEPSRTGQQVNFCAVSRDESDVREPDFSRTSGGIESHRRKRCVHGERNPVGVPLPIVRNVKVLAAIGGKSRLVVLFPEKLTAAAGRAVHGKG